MNVLRLVGVRTHTNKQNTHTQTHTHAKILCLFLTLFLCLFLSLCLPLSLSLSLSLCRSFSRQIHSNTSSWEGTGASVQRPLGMLDRGETLEVFGGERILFFLWLALDTTTIENKQTNNKRKEECV